MSPIALGISASLLAGGATGAGALVIFFLPRVSERMLDVSLGFAAGVMLAATSFSLLVPSLECGGVWSAVVGMLIGVFFLILADHFTPHFHPVAGIKGPMTRLNRIWLFVLAITIHNFPEGMAVGVGFGSGNLSLGTRLAIGIGLQNIPEGLAVALPLLRENYSCKRAFLIALVTGLVEPIGGFLGVATVSIVTFLLPYGLAFAGGAMLFVISEEIIPETHTRGNDREATLGVIFGFILMMVIDTVFS